jgi:hypothetical protein
MLQLAQVDKNIIYKHWMPELWLDVPFADQVSFDYFNPNWSLSDELKYFSRKLRYSFFGKHKSEWITDKSSYVENQRKRMRIWGQKAGCAKNCLESNDESELLIFLDADAIPWNSLDGLFDEEYFDVALTLRKLNDVKIGFDLGVRMSKPLPYHAINAGVIIFRRNKLALQFVSDWIEEQRKMQYFMLEQTALSEICLMNDQDAFKQYRRPIYLSSGACLNLLPCEEYNNTYFSTDYSFPVNCRVAHFKGYLHQEKYLEQLKSIVSERKKLLTPN